MFGWSKKPKIRRRQVREHRARITVPVRTRLAARIFSWPALVGLVFVAGASAITVWGEAALPYSVGQRVPYPIYARVDFRVPDVEQTADDRRAARAATPSYYTPNRSALTYDSVRAELRRLYGTAADAATYEEFEKALADVDWAVSDGVYRRLRALVDRPEDTGRQQFEEWIAALPLENEYVVRGLREELRHPASTTDYIVLDTSAGDGDAKVTQVPHSQLVSQAREKALRGSAADVARRFPIYELRPAIEAIVFAAFQAQPTIIFDQERTVEEMRAAEEATPEALATYERDKPFVKPGVLGTVEYQLLKAEQAAYVEFLREDDPLAHKLRQRQLLRQLGLVVLVGMLSVGLLVYVHMHQPRIFEVRSSSAAFSVLLLATLLAARILGSKWGHIPELTFTPCLLSASILAIVYPRRFAIGASCITIALVTVSLGADFTYLLTLLVGVTVIAFQLHEIRSRTKIITAGLLTALAITVTSAADGLVHGHTLDFVWYHALWAGGCALLASFVLSGTLPFIERLFRVATSLTLLEWRDPTKPLLQLLAREAPGTYNHSLVLGTLAEAACERIGANGLLAQVGSLYHDIGKISKAGYFAENQEGRINRHDNLAPTMSLLIILGHVKDGVEMAKEYKLPRVLHQFIGEHHGTTVVRYFHHMASEKQPQIASGKHDREVPEAEFRYTGPKPRTRESAVVMLCDGVESAVRAQAEPTVGRIESTVHQMVAGRMADGQLSDCDMTMRQLRQVEESLVKSLCAIYHGRVAYPKASKPAEMPAEPARVSV